VQAVGVPGQSSSRLHPLASPPELDVASPPLEEPPDEAASPPLELAEASPPDDVPNVVSPPLELPASGVKLPVPPGVVPEEPQAERPNAAIKAAHKISLLFMLFPCTARTVVSSTSPAVA